LACLYVRPAFDEVFHDFRKPGIEDRLHADGVDVRAMIDQQLNQIQAPFQESMLQRAVSRLLNGGTTFEKLLDKAVKPAIHGNFKRAFSSMV
jgi:hypothetical protein